MFIKTPDLTEEQILSAFQTYLVYDYPNSAQVLQAAAADRITAETSSTMQQNLEGFRKAPFRRTPGLRLKRLIRKVANGRGCGVNYGNFCAYIADFFDNHRVNL